MTMDVPSGINWDNDDCVLVVDEFAAVVIEAVCEIGCMFAAAFASILAAATTVLVALAVVAESA